MIPIKATLVTSFLLLIIISGLSGCRKKEAKTTPSPEQNQSNTLDIPLKSEVEAAIKKATELYTEKKAQGLDFSAGPCLSDEVIPDWVADIAHNPRQPIDNKKENQCAAYRQGKAHHFVELDLHGNLIRTM